MSEDEIKTLDKVLEKVLSEIEEIDDAVKYAISSLVDKEIESDLKKDASYLMHPAYKCARNAISVIHDNVQFLKRIAENIEWNIENSDIVSTYIRSDDLLYKNWIEKEENDFLDSLENND